MKLLRIAVIACLAVIALSCDNMGKKSPAVPEYQTEAFVKQQVEQMMQLNEYFDMDQLLSADMLALQKKAQRVHYYGDFCKGFSWNTGIMDACSEEQTVSIEGVQPIDSLHCDVAMRYVDEGCYDEPYVLHLLWENGQWRIDDMNYGDEMSATLREDCEEFYENMVEVYATTPAAEIMEEMKEEEPVEELYTDPACIYYNNPAGVQELIDDIKTCHELFKQNPEYTEEYGKQIDEMIARIAAHL